MPMLMQGEEGLADRVPEVWLTELGIRLKHEPPFFNI
jgi:hypothetical protein